MPPKRLGRDFKTIKVECSAGHEVARYRKPRSEWGERTHKLWLIEERLTKLATEPPILGTDQETDKQALDIPETGTAIHCGNDKCPLEIGKIAMVQGTVAIKLNPQNLKPTKG